MMHGGLDDGGGLISFHRVSENFCCPCFCCCCFFVVVVVVLLLLLFCFVLFFVFCFFLSLQYKLNYDIRI